MKAVQKLVIALSLVAGSVVAASAASPETAYLRSFQKQSGVPEPVKVVAPEIVGAPVGAEARISFVVDPAGVPQEVAVAETTHEGLAVAAVEAVKQWRFTPVVRDGATVATRVILPVRVARETAWGTRYAAR
jgi:TonB family protein